MTILYVPSNYASISAALSAASSGDVVEVSAGTYTENISLGTGVGVKAAFKERVILNGQVSMRSNSFIRGLDITYATASSSDAAILNAVATVTVVRITNCTITISGSGYGINLGNNTTEVKIERCYFTNGGVSSNRAILVSDGNARIKSCVFNNWLSSSTGTIRCAGAGTETVYNCTFYDCETTGSSSAIIRLEAGVGSTKIISNCIFKNCTVTGTTLTFYNVGTRYIANCCHHGNNVATLASGPTDLGGHVTSDPELSTTTFKLNSTSPCLRAGSATYFAIKSFEGHAFSDSDNSRLPDIGAHLTHTDSSHVLYVKWQNVTIGSGISLSVSGTDASIRRLVCNFDTPWDIAEYLEEELCNKYQIAQSGLEVTWDITNRYRVTSASANMVYTFTNSILGTDSSAGTTDTEDRLAQDSHFYEFNTSLDEQVQASYRVYEIMENAYGAPVGINHLANKEKVIFNFTGISNIEYIHDAVSIRDVMNLFYSGEEMRVYRAFPSVLDVYCENASALVLTGYSDIITTTESIGYTWPDNVLQRVAVIIEGYDVSSTTILGEDA